MKLAIMQPYFFPYLGYFQLIHAVDKFVFYDDANYINRGWVNRNRLLLNGKAHYFTVCLSGASQSTPIKDVRVLSHNTRWKRKMLATFQLAYKHAPYAESGMQLIEGSLSSECDSIATLARQSVQAVMEYLGLRRAIVETTQAYANAHLRGQARVLDICRQERADTYVNASGGRELYRDEDFSRAGIELRFISGRLPAYSQGQESFVPGLSVLDIIMQCSRQQILDMLEQYELCKPQTASVGSFQFP